MMQESSENELKRLHGCVDFSDSWSIGEYAKHLPGMTFRDVLGLGIRPEGGESHDYGNPSYKGGLGTLIEERFFGYRANSDSRPDFPEAGVELKTTCYDVLKKGSRSTGDRLSAGERLVIMDIPNDRPVESDLQCSHLWQKCRRILLVFYERDRTVGRLDQRIGYVGMFTPPEEDLEVMRGDYGKIVSYVQAGRADELSESLTEYLGACTKGETAARSWKEQYYPRTDVDGKEIRVKAKKRAFCFKRQYMDYVLHSHVIGQAPQADRIMVAGRDGEQGFEEHISRLVRPYTGKTDRELCRELDVPYTATLGNGNAIWSTLAFRMLGIGSNRAEEFVKAGISVRAVRVEPDGKIRENLSLAPFEFEELLSETWEGSELRTYLDETRFFFAVFGKDAVDGCYRFRGSCFWNMPVHDVEGPVRKCWERTREVVREGVVLEPEPRGNGVRMRNNLPKPGDNPIVHVRPHAHEAFYDLGDGTPAKGRRSNGSKLPDGRWMTRQSFWLNRDYVVQALEEGLGQSLRP